MFKKKVSDGVLNKTTAPGYFSQELVISSARGLIPESGLRLCGWLAWALSVCPVCAAGLGLKSCAT